MSKRFFRMTLIVVVFALISQVIMFAQDDGLVTVTIINTSDEHGWLQPFIPYGSSEIKGGAANVSGWWLQNENYDPDNMLLLSGGDNWTGPSISTWFEGEPVVEAFNLMDYDASAIGNHEFDFGREVMEQRFSEAKYPYLAANIRYADTGELVDFAQPYIVIDVNGVGVGVIGLTSTSTPTTTHPKNVSDLVFVNYEDTLREFVPQMRDDGAEIIVVLSHACMGELTVLSGRVSDLVDAMFAGHCNELGSRMVDDVSVMGSGSNWHSYARLTISYDTVSAEIVEMEQSVVDVAYDTDDGNPVEPDAEITTLVDDWQRRVDEQLSVEIGYTDSGIARRSAMMGNWVTDSWLWAFPYADVAITNWGGFRQDISSGAIAINDIVGLLPFDNYIVEVEITGEQLLENLSCCGGAVGGTIYSIDGEEFDPDAIYRVLISDFLYYGGDGYLFGEQDPEGYNTGVHWRQPVIDYTESLGTDEDNPLENYLDVETRIEN